VHPTNQTIQAVHRRLGRRFVHFNPTRAQTVHAVRLTRRIVPFESIDQDHLTTQLTDHDRG
jgi:hypothetical protein